SHLRCRGNFSLKSYSFLPRNGAGKSSCGKRLSSRMQRAPARLLRVKNRVRQGYIGRAGGKRKAGKGCERGLRVRLSSTSKAGADRILTRVAESYEAIGFDDFPPNRGSCRHGSGMAARL